MEYVLCTSDIIWQQILKLTFPTWKTLRPLIKTILDDTRGKIPFSYKHTHTQTPQNVINNSTELFISFSVFKHYISTQTYYLEYQIFQILNLYSLSDHNIDPLSFHQSHSKPSFYEQAMLSPKFPDTSRFFQHGLIYSFIFYLYS